MNADWGVKINGDAGAAVVPYNTEAEAADALRCHMAEHGPSPDLRFELVRRVDGKWQPARPMFIDIDVGGWRIGGRPLDVHKLWTIPAPESQRWVSIQTVVEWSAFYRDKQGSACREQYPTARDARRRAKKKNGAAYVRRRVELREWGGSDTVTGVANFMEIWRPVDAARSEVAEITMSGARGSVYRVRLPVRSIDQARIVGRTRG